MGRGHEGIALGLLPNIRKLFIPDPGMVMIEVDLSGADAQVVAWEAGDEDLKEAFKQGVKIHKKNAEDMFGSRLTSLDPESYQYYHLVQRCKHSVHGINYGEQDRTLAISQGWTMIEAKSFRQRWITRHPGIPMWHNKVMDNLERTRSVSNAFGFRRYYFERVDDVFTKALAWIPQSTISTVSFKGALQAKEKTPWVQFLLQVHDSLLAQIEKRRVRDLLLLKQALLNQVPYPDPLTIPWDLAISPISWGDAKKVSWEEAIDLKF